MNSKHGLMPSKPLQYEIHAPEFRAFTLIELLVVIAIIGILASVVLAAANLAEKSGRDKQREAALTEIQQALELYASDHNGAYPASQGWQGQCAAWGSYSANNVIPGLVSGGYIPAMPADPSMVASANQDCILYISDGTNYKVLDYNMVDSLNPGGVPSLVDPVRNIGKSYSVNPCPGATEGTVTWAVWSSNTAKCEW